MNSDSIKLNRTLHFKDVIILAFSTMIGWGWIVLTGQWVVQGGAIGAALAFLCGALLCILVGIAYCELTTMLPYAGGELVFSYKAMGYNASWFTGWMITFAYIGVAAWEGPALATAIDYLVEIPRYGYLFSVAGFDVYLTWLIIPAVVGGILIFINFRGINISAFFQAAATVILALGGVVFALIGVFKGSAENARPLFTTSKGVFTVILAVPAMFVGFDVIPQTTEEMNLPVRKIPKAIIASICLAAAWYVVMIVSAAFAAPAELLGNGGITVANAATYATGNAIVGKIIIVTAIMGILTSWNGFIIGATRVLYSMGRAKMIPEAFGQLHSKHKTPWVATLFVGAITIFSPLLGSNSLGWFVDASAFGTVIAYFMVSLSFVVLRFKCPEIKRPYKAKHGKLIGILSIAVSLMFIVLYLPVGSSSLEPVEWCIVLSWVVLGLVIYLAGIRYKTKYEGEREKAMYGD